MSLEISSCSTWEACVKSGGVATQSLVVCNQFKPRLMKLGRILKKQGDVSDFANLKARYRDNYLQVAELGLHEFAQVDRSDRGGWQQGA
jgi:hypothetical protein